MLCPCFSCFLMGCGVLPAAVQSVFMMGMESSQQESSQRDTLFCPLSPDEEPQAEFLHVWTMQAQLRELALKQSCEVHIMACSCQGNKLKIRVSVAALHYAEPVRRLVNRSRGKLNRCGLHGPQNNLLIRSVSSDYKF